MPELPDVAIFKQYLDSTALHQPVERTSVLDEAVLKGVTAKKLQRRLKGEALISTRRHGKHLFAQIEENGWLRLHFGMTGALDYAKQAKPPPDHTHVRIDFSGGYRLAYVCPRTFGEVGLVKGPDVFIEKNELGPDALALDFDTFQHRMEDRRGAIKPALTKQQIVAGIGNIYADEILFQARVHPQAKGRDLDTDTLREIFQQMKDVLRTAIGCQADPEALPDGFLLPHRRGDGHCPGCDGELKQIKVSSRTTYFCPNCQERP